MPEPSQNPVDVLRVIAAHGLPRRGRASVSMEVSEQLWPDVIRQVTRQRILGLALAATDDGSLRLSEGQRTQVVERQASAMGMVLVLEQLLRDLSSALSNEGLPTIVLKGCAFATTFYPRQSWRPYGDLDLLVPAPGWGTALELLGDLGFARILPEPRPGFDVRFGKGASFEDTQGRQVDLHRTLALGPFGLWIDGGALLEGTTGFSLGERSFLRLDDTNALIHACIHAALGWQEPLLIPLRDVLQIAWSGGVDWDLLGERTRTWRQTAPVSHALRTASERLDVPLPAEGEEILSTPFGWIERRALSAYVTDRRRRGGIPLATLWAIPGLAGRLAYARAMLFPDRRFLDARKQAGTGTVTRRLMVPIRWAFDRTRWTRRRRDRRS